MIKHLATEGVVLLWFAHSSRGQYVVSTTLVSQAVGDPGQPDSYGVRHPSNRGTAGPIKSDAVRRRLGFFAGFPSLGTRKLPGGGSGHLFKVLFIVYHMTARNISCCCFSFFSRPSLFASLAQQSNHVPRRLLLLCMLFLCSESCFSISAYRWHAGTPYAHILIWPLCTDGSSGPDEAVRLNTGSSLAPPGLSAGAYSGVCRRCCSSLPFRTFGASACLTHVRALLLPRSV
jgi:hypothetical protein